MEQTNMVKPDNNLVWAILCTVLCCLPFGIVSIVYASKVDSLWAQGQYQAASDAASKAKNYAMIGAICGVVGIVLYILLIVIAGLAS